MPSLAPSLPAACSDAEADQILRERAHAVQPRLLERIARNGYSVVPQVLDPAHVATLRLCVEALCAEEGECGFRENYAQRGKIGHGMLGDLVNKGEAFDGIWDHPLVVGLAHHLLQDSVRLYCLNYRGPRQGEGLLSLHADQAWTAPGAPAIKLQCIIPLVDFTPHNGATRFVPGSHLPCQESVRADIDASGHHPAEVVASASAGSFILYHGGCFHGTAVNSTSLPRHALVAAYVARNHEQLCDQARHLRFSTAKRLNGFQRWLLDT